VKMDNRVAIVTGAGQGIGASIASGLAKDGAFVVIADVNEDNARGMEEQIRSEGGRAAALKADATSKEQVDAMVESILAEHGKIDILVNNVGIIRDNFLVKMPEEDWDLVLDINLKSYFLCSQAVVRDAMIPAKYGRIVNISSRAYQGNVGQANYSAAKGGVVSLTRTMARELGRYNITSNCIAPGVINTPMYQGLREDVQENLRKTQPIRDIGSPDDVAYATRFFASDDAWYITGQVLYVCGGKSVGGY